MYLKNVDEKIEFYGKRNEGIVTSLGRIYLEENIRISNDLMSELKHKARELKLKEEFLSGEKKEIEYILDKVIFLKENMELSSYLKISNLFMRCLIENKVEDEYEKLNMRYIVKGIIDKLGYLEFDNLSDNDIHSLLKPVYYRYWCNRNKNMSKVLVGTNYNNLPEKIILYDVECKIVNSKLKLLDRFEVDLSEVICVDMKCLEYKCVSLGEVTRFNKVEINFNKEKYFICKIIFHIKK